MSTNETFCGLLIGVARMKKGQKNVNCFVNTNPNLKYIIEFNDTEFVVGIFVIILGCKFNESGLLMIDFLLIF